MGIVRVGVVGAGTMGSGIAQKIAQEGFEVVLVDVTDELVQKGLERIKAMLKEAVERKIFTPQQVEQILARIKPTTDKKSLADCDIVIEAVFEDIDVKRSLFAELDQICKPDSIFATNTSSLLVSDLASATNRPQRFIGLHYFYHPAKNRLLEVIPTEQTASDVLAAAEKFAALHAKTHITVKDAPGFAVNRFFVPWLNEATRIMQEGVANAATIDAAAMQTFGIGMGPFQLMNVTGIPIAYHSCCSLAEKLGEFYAPSDALKKQFEAKQNWDLSGEVEEGKFDAVSRRLLAVVFYVVSKMLDEGVATIRDIDIGARVGLRWRMGPFEMMNERGISDSYWLVFDVHRRYGLAIPQSITERYLHYRLWEMRYVEYERRGEVGFIAFSRPEAMNALNEEVIGQFEAAVERALADDNAQAVVIYGTGGKAFIAGADINFFVDNIKSDNFAAIYALTERGHALLSRIETAPKRFVAAVDGFALGGGLETALACHTIIATHRSTLGLPETGIGIYPGLGGMHRATRRLGLNLARWLVFTGGMLSASDAETIGLVDYVVDPADLLDKAAEIALSRDAKTKEKPRAERVGQLPQKWAEIEALFDEKGVAALLEGTPPGDSETARKVAAIVSRKAPLAVKLAAKIMDEGAKLPLPEALKLDLKYLKEIFSTDDALEGLSSVLERRRPNFSGK